MTDKDLSPDDLLDFHYDNAGPRQARTEKAEKSAKTVKSEKDDFEIFDKLVSMEPPENPVIPESPKRGLTTSFDSYDEYKRYEESKKRAEQQQQPQRQQPKHARQGSASGAGSYDAYDFNYEYERQPRTARNAESGASSRSSRKAEYEYERQSRSSRNADPELVARAPRNADPGIAPRMGSGQKSASAAKPAKHSKRSVSDDSIFELYDREHGIAPEPAVEKEPSRPKPSAKEIEALKKASRDAQDRYKSNYTKGQKKKEGRAPVSKGDKILTVVYIIALAAFAVSMTVMNVLPAQHLIAMYVVLALISIFLLVKTRKRSPRKASKVAATILSVVFILIYGVGTAYALGTLSFLSHTSVDSAKAVANITRDPFNIVVTGMDVSGTIDEQGRSDVNMVLTVNPKTATVLMTSIPRDYEIYMPDHDNAMDKLTHTGFYSVETTVQAEEQLLDIDANYYVKVNFTTVEKFIDAIGGVDVYSEYEFTPVKMKDWTVHEGINHMNGKQAVAFARERKAFPSGDNQRIKNQQAVLEAIIKKATSSRTMILNYSQILTSLKPYFEMSLSSGEIRQLVKMQLSKDPDWKIYKNTIVGGNDMKNTYTAGNAYVMSQDPVSIENAKTLINAVLDGQALGKDDDGNVYVKESE